MSRFITTHQVNDVNRALTIEAVGDVGPGNAHARYTISYASDESGDAEPILVKFQDGPPAVVGVNGITNEVLLAILIDRTAGFQNGPYACTENQEGLTALMAAQDAFTRRTNERRTRGVEGQLRA